MPDVMSIILVVQTLLILWLAGKVDRLEKDIDFKMKVPMYGNSNTLPLFKELTHRPHTYTGTNDTT
mgnify:CR=1 FL=1